MIISPYNFQISQLEIKNLFSKKESTLKLLLDAQDIFHYPPFRSRNPQHNIERIYLWKSQISWHGTGRCVADSVLLSWLSRVTNKYIQCAAITRSLFRTLSYLSNLYRSLSCPNVRESLGGASALKSCHQGCSRRSRSGLSSFERAQ
jgi:hypothetical protein